MKPSQRCPKCLHVKPKTLDERIHHCEVCGYKQDRDLASSEVMVLWALNDFLQTEPGLITTLVGFGSTQYAKEAWLCLAGKHLTDSGAFGTSALRRGASSSTTSPKERKHCGSMKQLGAAKRQKHHPADGNSETPSSRSRAG